MPNLCLYATDGYMQVCIYLTQQSVFLDITSSFMTGEKKKQSTADPNLPPKC